MKTGILKNLKRLLGLSGGLCFLFFSTFHPLLHNHPLVIAPSSSVEGHKNCVIKVNHVGEHKHHKFCPACHFLSLGKSFEHHYFGWEILLKILPKITCLLDELIICQTAPLFFNNRSPPMP